MEINIFAGRLLCEYVCSVLIKIHLFFHLFSYDIIDHQTYNTYLTFFFSILIVEYSSVKHDSNYFNEKRNTIMKVRKRQNCQRIECVIVEQRAIMSGTMT